MTLIDTSAWIEFFRSRGNPEVKAAVRDLISTRQAAYTCPVAFELFAGAREHEKEDLNTGLGLCSRVHLLPEDWDAAGMLAGSMHAKGVRIPPSDVLIATTAIRRQLPVLTTDSHFNLLKKEFLPGLVLI